MAVIGAAGSRGIRPGSRVHCQRGMVTVEFAIALLSLVVVLALMLFAVSVAIAHARAQEAARSAARAAARGDSDRAVTAIAVRSAPDARVAIRRRGADVQVDVALSVALPVGLKLSGVTVRSQSYAVAEPK